MILSQGLRRWSEIVSIAIIGRRARGGRVDDGYEVRTNAIVQSCGGIGGEMRTINDERLAVAPELLAT